MSGSTETDDEFRVCPSCGYGHGFHVYFRKDPAGMRIGLICPSCGHAYDLGWVTPDVPDTAAAPGPVFTGRP